MIIKPIVRPLPQSSLECSPENQLSTHSLQHSPPIKFKWSSSVETLPGWIFISINACCTTIVKVIGMDFNVSIKVHIDKRA